ncbi:MAG: hypothetical protein HY864_18500 [Chloroflexi bacterium]|nr:hypothetical protein [Chloroflexota bacterium]
MRKNIAFFLLFVFVFTACGAPATNTPAPTEVMLATPTPELIKFPSPSEIGLTSPQDAGSDIALLSVEAVKVDDGQLISRADLLTALKLKDDVLKAYENAIDAWLKTNGFGITRKEYIFNPTVLQWRIIIRDAITSNIIATEGFDEPVNFEVTSEGVGIASGYKPVMLVKTKDTEARLIGPHTVLLSDSVNYLGTRVFTQYIDLLTRQKQVIPGFETIIEEASKIDFARYELTESQIENGLLDNEYLRIKEEDLPKAIAWLHENRKLDVNTNRPLPIVKPVLKNGNDWHVSYMGAQNVNIMPRIPLLVETEFGDVFTILYEGVQVDENGVNQAIEILWADEGIKYHLGTTHSNSSLTAFTKDKIKSSNRNMNFGFSVEYKPKSGDELKDYVNALINITGGHIDPNRELFRQTGKFSDTTSLTIFVRSTN